MNTFVQLLRFIPSDKPLMLIIALYYIFNGTWVVTIITALLLSISAFTLIKLYFDIRIIGNYMYDALE